MTTPRKPRPSKATLFRDYAVTWRSLHGLDETVCEWLAKHVGDLVSRVERLERQVKRMERKAKKG